jgi:hypothetical protein
MHPLYIVLSYPQRKGKIIEGLKKIFVTLCAFASLFNLKNIGWCSMSQHLLDEKNQLAHPCISKIVVLICNRKVVISGPAW